MSIALEMNPYLKNTEFNIMITLPLWGLTGTESFNWFCNAVDKIIDGS